MIKENKDYSKLGFVYTVYVCANVLVQYIFAYLVYNNIIPKDTNIINLLGNGLMYIIGLLILIPLVYKPSKLNKQLDKNKTKISEFFQYFFIAYFLMICSNIIGLIITGAISLVKGTPVINPIGVVLGELDISISFILACILAPIIEELFFRKFIIDKLHIHGKWVTIFISGLMFGLFHGNLNQFTYAFILGMFLAYIYVKKGNINVCILLHAAINSIGFIAVLITNNIDVEFLNNITSTDVTSLIASISMSDVISLLLLLLFEFIIFTVFILGLVFLVLEFKNIKSDISQYRDNSAITLRQAITSKGILAFTILHIIIIFKQLFE